MPQSLLSFSVYHSNEAEKSLYRYRYKYVAVHRRLAQPALLSAEWALYRRSGYAAEPPQGSARVQVGEWTLALHSAKMSVFCFRSHGAWISLLLLVKAIRQTVLSFKLVNYGDNFGFGIEGCISNSEQKHHATVWPHPLHHSRPPTGWNTLMVWEPGGLMSLFSWELFWTVGGHSERGLHRAPPTGTSCI